MQIIIFMIKLMYIIHLRGGNVAAGKNGIMRMQNYNFTKLA